MKTIYIPSSGWVEERSRCEIIINKFALTDPDKVDSLILDINAIRREKSDPLAGESYKLIEIDFRDWVGETLTEGGVIDIQVIRRTALTMCNGIIMINAIGFDSKIIYRALAQLRIAFYALSSWPNCLVLICDDAQLHQVSPVLANTFYIQPYVSTKFMTKQLVRQINHEAFFIRYFGAQKGVALKITRNFSNWLAKRQNKREQKISGWFFQE